MEVPKFFKLPNINNYPNPYKGIERPNQSITDEQAFIDYFNLMTKEHYPESKKYYCVMLFTEVANITGNTNDKNKFINTHNAYFHNGTMALNYYFNSNNPYAKLIDATSIHQLIQKRNKSISQYK